MNFFLYSLLVLSVSIVLLMLTSRSKKTSEIIFLISQVTGCVLALISAVHVFVSRVPINYRSNFRMPVGEFYVGVDFLSAFFVLTVTVLFSLAGVYGYSYLKEYEKKNLGAHYALYNLALISLLLVVTAKNAVLFLIAWEMVTLSSYFLITFYDKEKAVRKAGYLFLIATHTGTFLLWIMFLLMARQSGSMNFDQMALSSFPLPLTGLLFILGVIGFGVKTGFIPLHIWLPHAHPVAPSHVSAVLSGVMIKMGIYGLMRIIGIIKDFPEWCAVVLLLIGMISGVGGVLYALGQHEIKKLLAYHSIENIGIIALGMGIGLGGQISHKESVALIGYAGALLHVFNHAVFKGLLFLSAGSVIRAAHTGQIDRLGGLLRPLPWTGHLFLIGSLAICGLPLFNGFISEWLVYRALFEGMFHFKINALVFSGMAIVSLALIGGLAAACFAKAFGTIFLGHNRSVTVPVGESPWLMRVPMAVLGGLCLWIWLFPGTMVSFSLGAAAMICGAKATVLSEQTILNPIVTVILVLLILIGTMAVLALLKMTSMRSLPVETAPTWACGYSTPSPRMQYTASSFAQPILQIFRNVSGAEFSENFIFRPVFQFIKALSAKLKIIQNGYTQWYLLYIFVFLLILLIWKMV